MQNLLQSAYRLSQRFRTAQDGVAAVEFALIMPLLLLLYIGSVESSRALAHDRRLTLAASAMGDLVAQTKSSLSELDVADYFNAAEITVAPYDASNLQQVITCVKVSAAGVATVEWSRGDNGGIAHATGAIYNLPNEFANISLDSYAIVSEASMNYVPITSFVFSEGFRMYKEYLFVPRYGEKISVNPV